MRTYKGKGPRTLILVMVAVLLTGFAIGFSAVSSSLAIKSKLNINPDTGNFSVVFSSSSTSLETNNIVPTKSSDDIIAINATINNDLIPTLTFYDESKSSDINYASQNDGSAIVFTDANQSITYTLYAMNVGKYDAYLTSVVFGDIVCTPIEGTSTFDETICDDLNISVQIGNETFSANTGRISGHKLAIGDSEQVVITVTAGSNIANSLGDFAFSIGDISLLYSTLDYGTALLGDVNDDGVVNSQDAIDLSYYLFRSTDQNGSSLAFPDNGDMDSDGKITGTDINLLSNQVSLVTSSIPDGTGILGDVDGNGLLETNDSTMIMQYAAANITASSLVYNNCDVNGSGSVDGIDSALIQQVISEIYSKTDNDGDDTGGSTQVYKPQHYSWSSGSIGGTLPGDAKTTVSALNLSYPVYLGLDAGSDNIVTAAYACFTRNGTEYCLKGGDDGAAYASNQTILQEAFADSLDACSFGGDDSDCYADDLSAHVRSYGFVSAGVDSAYCYVNGIGRFECIEL